MLRYVKYQMKSQIEGIANKWFLRVKNGEQIDLQDLAEHMSNHNTPYSKGAIVGMLTDMVACIKEQLLEGKTVKLADLAIFSLGIRCRGEVKPENLTVANIKTYTFNARGTGQLSPKAVAQKIRLKEQDIYELPGNSQVSAPAA